MHEEQQKLKSLLDDLVHKFNHKDFITKDPISIPHQYTLKADIEIAGFFSAIFSWGNRTTIINSSQKLMAFMDHKPYDFVCNHSEEDLKNLNSFVHRTFNSSDLLYFLYFLKHHYSNSPSLEDAFMKGETLTDFNMYRALGSFHNYFFSLPHLPRTKKHIASPLKKSTCKRLLMYLRWMVRKDHNGVDFGIWQNIPKSALMIPYDVHVDRIARSLNIVTRKQIDWQTVVELTDFCKLLDPEDPCKYDYALFGLGVQKIR